MKTIKLYDQDSECFGFESKVVSVRPQKEGILIELESTAFFPEAGGQSADSGFLGGFRVKDVMIDEQGRILHLCQKEDEDVSIPKAGDVIKGEIDAERRLSFMRHHSGEHLFSGLAHRCFSYDNVGFHLSDHICTMDYNGVLSPEDVAMLERKSNEIILQNRPILSYYPDEATLEKADYRCKGELTPPIRFVEIENADLCACCAPHVRFTGEIGLLKVVEAKAYKGGMRLAIVCGLKAFDELSRRFDTLLSASGLLSSHWSELPLRIRELQEERFTTHQRIISLEQALLEARLAHIPATSSDALLFVEAADEKAAREIINVQMTLREGFCGVFIGKDENYRFILGSRAHDMKKTADQLRQSLGGKCGGSSTMIQGQLPASQEAILDLLGS